MIERRSLYAALILLIVLAIVAGSRIKSNSQQSMPLLSTSGDALIYSLSYPNGRDTLRLYDPQTRESTTLVPIIESTNFPYYVSSGFHVSDDGRIAYPFVREDDMDVLMLDLADRSISNISQNPTMHDYPLAWSHDGRYLAFASYRDDDDQFIYVWDGTTTINVTPTDMENTAKRYWASWSYDGRLTFTVSHLPTSLEEGDSSEIYLWDGIRTVNLSQNPAGYDQSPEWSTDGRFIFLSERNGAYDIYLWDGESLLNGSPDVATFTAIAPELSDYYSAPAWTPEGDIVFVSQGPQDTHAQIYLWDGDSATDISQNPTLHNAGARWSDDGRWASVTFFSREQLLFVRDAENQILLKTEGQYVPAWSSSGLLAFCRFDRKGNWVLSIWDGQEIIKVAQGGTMWVQWQSGSSTVCTSG